jgi:hypothetical protein
MCGCNIGSAVACRIRDRGGTRPRRWNISRTYGEPQQQTRATPDSRTNVHKLGSTRNLILQSRGRHCIGHARQTGAYHARQRRNDTTALDATKLVWRDVMFMLARGSPGLPAAASGREGSLLPHRWWFSRPRIRGRSPKSGGIRRARSVPAHPTGPNAMQQNEKGREPNVVASVIRPRQSPFISYSH